MNRAQVAAEMFDWADAHAARIGSPLVIETDKPLLFWGADQGQQRDADRASADQAMSALRQVVAPTLCDDCDEPIDTKNDKFFRLSDPWGRLTGDCVCENCREKRWDRHQERLMEGA